MRKKDISTNEKAIKKDYLNWLKKKKKRQIPSTRPGLGLK